MNFLITKHFTAHSANAIKAMRGVLGLALHQPEYSAAFPAQRVTQSPRTADFLQV